MIWIGILIVINILLTIRSMILTERHECMLTSILQHVKWIDKNTGGKG